MLDTRGSNTEMRLFKQFGGLPRLKEVESPKQLDSTSQTTEVSNRDLFLRLADALTALSSAPSAACEVGWKMSVSLRIGNPPEMLGLVSGFCK